MRGVIVLFDIHYLFMYIYIFVVGNRSFYLYWLSLENEIIIDGTNLDVLGHHVLKDQK